MAGEGWAQPPRKPPSASPLIGPHMAGIRTDEEYDGFVKENKGQTVSKCLRRLRSMHARIHDMTGARIDDITAVDTTPLYDPS